MGSNAPLKPLKISKPPSSTEPNSQKMLANLLRKKGVPACLGAITFLLLLTLGYQSGNPESIGRVKLDAEDADIAASYPSPSSYLPDLSKLADSLSAAASSALGSQTQKGDSFEKSFSPDVEIARENEGVVVKRKMDDKHSSEGNPCIMKRKAAVRRV